MTVQTSGTLTLTASDFKTWHRDVEIGVKVISWDGMMPVIALVEKKGAVYESTYILYEFDDANQPEKITAAAGGTVNWITSVLLPKINEMLALRFKATTGTIPVVTPGSLLDIDSKLGSVLAWQPQANGTLRVDVK